MAAILNSAILNSAIVDSTILHKTLTQTNSIWCKLIHSHSTWWWQPSCILPSWIQPFCVKLWLKLIQSESNSFILSQLDEGSHLELCHFGFTHFVQNSDSNYFNLTQNHSFSHNLMMAAILNSAMLNSDTAILDSDPCYLLSDSLKNTLTPIWLWIILIQSDSNSFLLM